MPVYAQPAARHAVGAARSNRLGAQSDYDLGVREMRRVRYGVPQGCQSSSGDESFKISTRESPREHLYSATRGTTSRYLCDGASAAKFKARDLVDGKNARFESGFLLVNAEHSTLDEPICRFS